jgi:PmbA protein
MTVTSLIEKAMRRAQGTEASVTRTESANVSYQQDKLKSAETQQTTHVEVRVIVDGKVGASHTTDVADTDGVVDRALEAAEFGSPAYFEFPGPADVSEVKLFDPAVPDVSAKDMVDLGAEMMAIVKDYNPDISTHAGASKGVCRTEIVTSAGAAYSTEETSFNLCAHGELIRGTDILMAGHDLGWRKRDIDHTAVAGKAVEWFMLAEKTVPIRSGDMPVIFTPEGMSVLGLALVLGVNGKNVVLGESPLAGRLGETIADKRFSLIDDPLVDYAVGSASIDDEAVPRRVTPVIENGVLRSFLYDLDAAGRAGTRTSGHGRGCRPTNLIVKKGDTPYAQMIADTKEGLLVHAVLGLGQGNAISGEFSVNVCLGYKIEDGQIAGRVKDVMLAGNTYDAIKNIEAIGDEPEWAGSMFGGAMGGAALVPPIKIGRLSVVAR